MPLTKRKKTELDTSECDECDSFNRHHTSLKVNLSYTTDFADFGDESLSRTVIGNSDKGLDNVQDNRRLSRNKNILLRTNNLSILNNEDLGKVNRTNKYIINYDKSVQTNGVQLQCRTINLEDKNLKKQAIHINHKHQKDTVPKENNPYSLHVDKESVHISERLNDLTSDSFIGCNQDININQRKKLLSTKNTKQVCKIIEDVTLNKNFPFSIKKINQPVSPILSGNNEKLTNVSKTKSGLYLQTNSGKNINDFSSIPVDNNTNMKLPIDCPSFIINNTISHKDKLICSTPKSDISSVQAMHTINKIISMEMTEVQDGIHINESYISIQNHNSSTNNHVQNDKKLEFKNKNDCTEKTKLSLNVNAPLDMINETIISDKMNSSDHESINTSDASLQMNTSIDCLRKTPPIKKKENNLFRKDSSTNQIENNKEGDIYSLENISLIERLRKISTGNQNYDNQLDISETENNEEIEDIHSNNVINTKNQDDDRIIGYRNSNTYMKGTPYPITCSDTLLTPTKRKISEMYDKPLSGIDDLNRRTYDHYAHEKCVSPEKSKEIEDDTIILGTQFSNPFLTQKNINTNVSQKTEHVLEKKGKRKLLPLHESSQLFSITPIKENNCMCEKPVLAKPKKKLKKKYPKKGLTASKSKLNSIEHNIINDQPFLDNDYDTDLETNFENKEIEKKKVRKPRKVISKKIIIKKKFNKDILNIIEEDRQSSSRNESRRGSSADFTEQRTIPIQWDLYRSEKIIIVATGLSNEDKNLIRNIIKSLGYAEMDSNVSRRTTHVVGTGMHTMNFLRGIIRGCWLLTLEWVTKSLENNTWLDPEEFEIKCLPKAVLENRKDRQFYGPSYIPVLFITCGLIYIEHKTVVPSDILKELIKTASGRITENPKLANIVIGKNGLKESWIIDSIIAGDLQPTKKYQRKQNTAS